MAHLVCEDDNSPLWWGSTVCSHPSSSHFPGLSSPDSDAIVVESLAPTADQHFVLHHFQDRLSYQVLQKGVVFIFEALCLLCMVQALELKGTEWTTLGPFFPSISMLWDVLSKGPEANLFRANSMAEKTPKAETGWRLRLFGWKNLPTCCFRFYFGKCFTLLQHWSPVDLPRLCMCCWCHLPDSSESAKRRLSWKVQKASKISIPQKEGVHQLTNMKTVHTTFDMPVTFEW